MKKVGCVGLTGLIEEVPVSRTDSASQPQTRDLPDTVKRPRLLRTVQVKGSTENRQGLRPTKKNDRLDYTVLGFTTWCVSTTRSHPSVNQEGNPAPSVFSRPFGLRPLRVLSGPLGSDHAGSDWRLWALTALGLHALLGLLPLFASLRKASLCLLS